MRFNYRSIAIAVLAGIVAGGVFYETQSHTTLQTGAELTAADFGGVSLRIEFATTTEARERGLGGRASLPDDYGMLFVFNESDHYGFWMKDTLIPLDIFWLDDKRQVVSVAEGVATSTYPHVFYPSWPARYVLETVAGYAQEHHITNGTILLLKKSPTVSE